MLYTPTHCPTGIPGEPDPPVAEGFLWWGAHLEHQAAARSLEGNIETTTGGRQEVRAAAAAHACPPVRPPPGL